MESSLTYLTHTWHSWLNLTLKIYPESNHFLPPPLLIRLVQTNLGSLAQISAVNLSWVSLLLSQLSTVFFNRATRSYHFFPQNPVVTSHMQSKIQSTYGLQGLTESGYSYSPHPPLTSPKLATILPLAYFSCLRAFTLAVTPSSVIFSVRYLHD